MHKNAKYISEELNNNHILNNTTSTHPSLLVSSSHNIYPTHLFDKQPTNQACHNFCTEHAQPPWGTGQLLGRGLKCNFKIIKPSQTRKPKNTLLRMYHDIHLIRMLLWEVQQQFQQQHPNQLELQTWTVHQGYSLDTPCVQQKDWNRLQLVCKSSSLLPWNPPNHVGKDVSRKLYKICTSIVQILHTYCSCLPLKQNFS